MKRGLLAAAMALTTAVGFAQVVEFTDVLDTVSTRTAATFSSTYVPVTDNYLAGHATNIEVFDGSGNYTGDLNITGIAPAGLGFFGLVATDGGAIYAYEDGGQDIWRWSSVADIPTKVTDTVNGLQRGGDTLTVGSDIIIAFTGSANQGPVEFFSDSFPFASGSFTFNQSVDLDAKTHVAIGDAGNTAFSIGDTNGPLSKWVKNNGVWEAAAGWPAIAIGGPVAYDDVNDIIFAFDMRAAGQKVVAYDSNTGDVLGENAVTHASFTTPGYAGSHVDPDGTGGTLWMSMRGPSNQVNMYEWTYVKNTSSVDDWSLYQQ